MQEAIEQDALLELPAVPGAPPDSLAAHEDLLRDTGDGALCTLPLAAHGRAVGALTFEWSRASAIDERTRGRVRDAGLLCGPILALMGRAEAGALERARGALLCWSDRVFGSDRVLAARAAAVAALLLLGLMLVPAPYRVTARATLEGRVQRALVAGVDGYVAEAHARAGDLVHAGDVIARLDDRDLRLERRKRESEKAQLEREYREALAGQDRTQVSILRAQIDQAAAQLDLVDEQLGRTSVVAPFDGIILEGDLDRSLGSPVELGVVLFELAPLDGYRIILEIDGRDIADVAVGQRGRLALAALPGRTQSLVLERITPVSTTEDGRSYFRAEAVLEQPIAALRPGMEGIAKIDAGRRRLLWIWTHGLIDWLRLWAWSFLP
jgi:RND family efflux transporter MFP subunit